MATHTRGARAHGARTRGARRLPGRVENALGGEELAGIVRAYTPLVKATAKRYSGGGAEFEDLVQEGYMQLVRLSRACPNMDFLASYLAKRLPGAVRAAARRMWARSRAELSEVSLGDDERVDVIARTTPDPGAERAVAEIEVSDLIERALDASDASIARELLGGAAQCEIARRIGISPQSMSNRVALIRRLLARYVKRR